MRPFSSKNSLVKFGKTQVPEARGRELGDVTVTGTKSTTQGRGGPELCWFRVAMKPYKDKCDRACRDVGVI